MPCVADLQGAPFGSIDRFAFFILRFKAEMGMQLFRKRVVNVDEFVPYMPVIGPDPVDQRKDERVDPLRPVFFTRQSSDRGFQRHDAVLPVRMLPDVPDQTIGGEVGKPPLPLIPVSRTGHL